MGVILIYKVSKLGFWINPEILNIEYFIADNRKK